MEGVGLSVAASAVTMTIGGTTIEAAEIAMEIVTGTAMVSVKTNTINGKRSVRTEVSTF